MSTHRHGDRAVTGLAAHGAPGRERWIGIATPRVINQLRTELGRTVNTY
jgi:hypothetical protein